MEQLVANTQGSSNVCGWEEFPCGRTHPSAQHVGRRGLVRDVVRRVVQNVLRGLCRANMVSEVMAHLRAKVYALTVILGSGKAGMASK